MKFKRQYFNINTLYISMKKMKQFAENKNSHNINLHDFYLKIIRFI